MTSSSGSTAAAELQSVSAALAEICDSSGDEKEHAWDPPRRFAGLSRRLQMLVCHLARSPELLSSSAALQTALRGMVADLTEARATLAAYRSSRSRVRVLIHCVRLADALRASATSISAWIALLDAPLVAIPDLRKKAADLSRDMNQSELKVTENEGRLYATLHQEATEGRQSSKAVQSAILMDVARALGIDPGDRSKLQEQIKLLKDDLSTSSTVTERRILVSLQKSLDNWSTDTCISMGVARSNFEEEAQILPFRNFLCPLTKEVMKDPVVLETSQTYERTAIQYWFNRCLEDCRDPICPVTGQVLQSLELRPNIGLAGTIEEWVNRNVEIQIKLALQYLGDESSCQLEVVESVLDNIYKISDEHPSFRYKVRNAGIVGLVVKLLKDHSSTMSSDLRSKALMALHSMVKDEESKLIMIEQGVTRLVIRSLTGDSTMEKEYALRLLLEFSMDKEYCMKVAVEKGALLLLSTIAENVEHPTLSNLAEEVLNNIEMVNENITYLASAGRFQPLVTQLCKGSEDAKMEIATLLGKINLTNYGKEYVATRGGKILIDMLSWKEEQMASSLQALYSLSTLEDNATVLVSFGLLPPLVHILFTREQGDSPQIKELAASILANIFSKSGHWELSFADKEGQNMQLEFVICKLLEMLSQLSTKCQVSILQVLSGIASSPRASDKMANYIRSSNSIKLIVPYLEHPEVDHRFYACRLLNLLSEKQGQILAEELRGSNKILLLKETLLDDETSLSERCEIASLLANLPTTDDEVKFLLGTDLLKWVIGNIMDKESSFSGRKSKVPRRVTVQDLLGLLLHYARSSDPTVMNLVKDNNFMAIFREKLGSHSHSKAKQRAALGLKYLSDSAKAYQRNDTEPQTPHGFCIPFSLICGKAGMVPVTCPLHSVACDEFNSFCLLKGNAIKGLVDLMTDDAVEVQVAAVEALSTLVSDDQGLKNAKEELEQLGIFNAAIHLFKETRPGALQEKVVAMIEKFLRLETLVQDYAIDQDLVMTLVGAMKHGNANTRRYAQDALTNLRQLSGVGRNTSHSNRARRASR